MLLVLIIFAFFSCGTAVQGAGSRLAFSYARDGALPGSKWISAVSERFKTPANALFGGALITVVFIGLEFASPTHDVKIWFITYPANTNVLVSLVSFGVSGIYLSFLLTVIGSMIARARGWVPAGQFTLGRWAWPVSVVAAVYLGLMLVNVVLPTGLSSARAYFNLRLDHPAGDGDRRRGRGHRVLRRSPRPGDRRAPDRHPGAGPGRTGASPARPRTSRRRPGPGPETP